MAYRISAKGKTGEIVIYEDIGPGMFGGIDAKTFAKDLKAIGNVDNLDIRINSYGGDVFDGLAIYRQLASHSANKTVHIDGIAASIASVIAMAGNDIKMSESGFMMIHDAFGGTMGNAEEIRQFADTLEMVSGSLADIYVSRTGMKKDKIVQMMHDETWMDAKEAMANGFATSMMENMKVAAHYDPNKYKFKHTPKILQQLSALDELHGMRPVYEASRSKLERQRAMLTLRNSHGG